MFGNPTISKTHTSCHPQTHSSVERDDVTVLAFELAADALAFVARGLMP